MSPLSSDPRRILVVDDDPQTRRFMCRVLEREGFEVVEAHDGREARLALDERLVDAVVTDLFMPGEDGIELLLELRRSAHGLPAVAVSGGGSRRDVSVLQAAQALGAVVLAKPFGPDNLISAVRQAIDKALG
jgi:DNA-binding response OmpR family regulator